MANVPSVPEVITVNSESLQSTIRNLLPSQRGFGSELQASNVITPIIDLTATAEGTTTPESLQQAISFGAVTADNIINTTTALAASPGFWRFRGNVSMTTSAAASAATIKITDGATSKNILTSFGSAGAGNFQVQNYDFIVFLRAGDSVNGTSPNTSVQICNIYYQVADVTGTLINPTGFTVE